MFSLRDALALIPVVNRMPGETEHDALEAMDDFLADRVESMDWIMMPRKQRWVIMRQVMSVRSRFPALEEIAG